MGKGNTSRKMKQRRSLRKHRATEKRRAKGQLGPRPQAKERDPSSFIPEPRRGLYGY